MIAERTVIGGTVKGGVVVPDGDNELPEGAHVHIVYPFVDDEGVLIAEMEAWDRASESAWAMIDRWEREEPLETR